MNFEQDELQKLSIHQLRKIAREIGVKSPTSLTKYNLITEILKVSSGINAPYFSKKGRPCIQDNNNICNAKTIVEEKVVDKPNIISEEKMNIIRDLINSCLDNIFLVLNDTSEA